VREDVEHATAEVVRMSRLVNGLLTLARAESTVSNLEPVRIVDVVTSRFGTWRAAAEERGVALHHHFADPELCVLSSPGHLEQVLDNVLSNALEVSPDDAAITVLSRREAEHVIVEVIDRGPGMSVADRQRAFDRFWRGPGLTGRTGSGMGLAIVKQLISDDGGSVRLDAANTGGLCVRITLRAA
jgi:two-component system, OmpR family, sensor kinase